MNFNRIFSIVLRQFYLMRGNFPRFLTLFVWIVVDIILWGFMTRYLNGVVGSSYNFVPAVLGAVLLWDFLIRVMQGISMAFMEDSWSRNLLNVFASPISVGEYVSGLVLSSIVTSLIGLVIMIVLATAIFGLSLFSYGLMTIPFLFILFLTGIALGIFCDKRYAAFRAVCRMAHLALTGYSFTVCRCFLSAVCIAALDAARCAYSATVLRL